MAVKFFRVGDADEGKVGTTENFFHIFRVAAEVRSGRFGAVVEFDGADGAQGALIAKDKIDGFMIDEFIGFLAILAADFVAEEGGKVDVRDDIEALAKDVIQELKTMSLGTTHELFFGTIAAAFNGAPVAIGGFDAGKDGDHQKTNDSKYSDSDEKVIHTFIVSRIIYNVKKMVRC